MEINLSILLLLICLLSVLELISSSAYILIENSISVSTGIELKVHYGGLSAETTLTCQSNGLTIPQIDLEATVQGTKDIAISIQSGSAATYVISCISDGTLIFKRDATLSVVETDIALCRDAVVITTPSLFISPAFQKISPHKNGTFSIYMYPENSTPEDFYCFVNKLPFIGYDSQTIIEDDTFEDIMIEKITESYYNVYPSLTLSESGVYGVECSALDTSIQASFLFSFLVIEESSLFTDRINYEDYEEVACPCDLMSDHCDAQCCCDKDCSESQIQSYSRCIDGPFGGDFKTIIEPDCSSTSELSPMDRFFCIKKSNSAHLGWFFNYVNDSSPVPDNWIDSNIAALGIPNPPATRGFPIYTKSENFNEGYLSLPGKVNELCVTGAPVRVLDDSRVTCDRMIVDNCNVDPYGVFSARAYLSPQSSLVDPCEWFTKVFSNGVGSNEVVVKVTYIKDDVAVNHLTQNILSDQSCTYAVTDVLYDVTVNASTVFSISAIIQLTDLSGRVGDIVTTSYEVRFNSLASLDPSVTENEVSGGYSRYDALKVKDGGVFAIPKYGDCLANKNTPEFGVSTIFQCYLDIDTTTQNNCSLLYKKVLETYTTFIENGTEVYVNRSRDSTTIPVILSNYQSISGISTSSMCDILPTYIHIKVYHEMNPQAGADVTNVTFFFEYGAGFQMTGTRVHLYGDLQFLVSDVPKEPCSFCWGDVAEFFQRREQLLNSLLVILAGVVCFAVPKNFYISKL